MQTKKIANTDLEVAPLAFGGNVFGWTIDSKKSFEILDNFIGEGFNLIDTANNYSYWVKGNDGGESERIIGDWLKKSKKRHEVVIATKVGGRGENRSNPNNTRKHILEEVDQSLLRLKTDYIDLYQLHYDDEETDVEETLSAFQELIQQGKIRWIGASNISPERLNHSLEVAEKFNLPKYQTLQPLYNLYERESFESNYQSIAEKHNLAVLSYYSLASGFLTGKYRSEEDLGISQRGKDVKKYLNDKGFRILKALDEIAQEFDTTPTAVSLAWLIHQPTLVAPIASATRVEHLKAFKEAVGMNLTKDALDRLNQAST